MMAYVIGKICVVDGFGLLSVCAVCGQLSWNVTLGQLAVDSWQTDNIPYPSTAQILPATYASIQAAQELPENGNKLMRHLGAQG
jgi:hypothetical protein